MAERGGGIGGARALGVLEPSHKLAEDRHVAGVRGNADQPTPTTTTPVDDDLSKIIVYQKTIVASHSQAHQVLVIQDLEKIHIYIYIFFFSSANRIQQKLFVFVVEDREVGKIKNIKCSKDHISFCVPHLLTNDSTSFIPYRSIFSNITHLRILVKKIGTKKNGKNKTKRRNTPAKVKETHTCRAYAMHPKEV